MGKFSQEKLDTRSTPYTMVWFSQPVRGLFPITRDITGQDEMIVSAWHTPGKELKIETNLPEVQSMKVTSAGPTKKFEFNGKEVATVDFDSSSKKASHTMHLPSGKDLTIDLAWPKMTPAASDLEFGVTITPDTKVIRMASPLKRKEVNIGRHLGLSLMLDVETQQPFADFAEIVHTLKNNNILTLLSLPLPLKTVRETTMKIVYNPAESVTKAASFAITYGAGSKVQSGSSPSNWSSTIVPVPSAVKAKCTKVADEWLARQRSSPLMAQRESQCLKKQILLCDESKEQCRIESTNQCKNIVEKELLADKEEAMESCEMREVAEIEKVECRRQQLSQSRPSQEVESYCSIIAVRMEQRHRAGAAIRRSASWMIENLEAASQAYTINVQAALHGVNHVVDQKIETQLTIGQKTPVTSIMEGLVKMNIAFKLPNQPKPFAVDVESNYLVRRPANAWDLKDTMVEDLTSKVNTKVEMGLMDGEKEVIAVDMIAKRTEELKQIVSLTEEFKQCEQMITKGEKLSLVCKKARSLAAILDLLEMNVA